MRVEKNGVRYFSLQELPSTEKTKKQKDNTEKQDKFLGTCKICKQKMSYIHGTNILACTNPECKGIKHTIKNKDGEEKAIYSPVFRVLDDKNSSYAAYLFEEEV